MLRAIFGGPTPAQQQFTLLVTPLLKQDDGRARSADILGGVPTLLFLSIYAQLSQINETELQNSQAQLCIPAVSIRDPDARLQEQQRLVDQFRAICTRTREVFNLNTAGEQRFNAHNFDAEPIVANRHQAVVEAIAAIDDLGIATVERGRYRTLLTAKRDALAASMQAAQLRFNAHNFDGA